MNKMYQAVLLAGAMVATQGTMALGQEHPEHPEHPATTQEAPEAAKLSDEVVALFTSSKKAISKLDMLTYDFTFSVLSTAQPDQTMKFKGNVEVIRKTSELDSLVHVVGKMDMAHPVPEGMDEYKMEMAGDGETAYFIDSMRKVFLYCPISEGGDFLIMQGGFGLLGELVRENPFTDELGSPTGKIEGDVDVDDVTCQVALVEYEGGFGKARWYFGKEDHLPRRVDRIFGEGEQQQMLIHMLASLDTKAELTKEQFVLKAPEGFTTEKFEMPQPGGDEPELLNVGDMAPEWELEDSNGNVVKLKDLRGSVVVMDFWATWCGPCKKAMPGVQKLHDHFKGKPVKVFGVNSWEDDPDKAVKFMKDKEYTYGLLLRGDEVASQYKVTGIPTFYVIGKDGKILHHTVGYDPEAETKLMELIEKELAK